MLILVPQIWNLAIVLQVFLQISTFPTIWMDPVKHTRQNNAEWYSKYAKNQSGGRLLNILRSQNLRTHIYVCQKRTFLKRIIRNRSGKSFLICFTETI